MPKPLPIRMTLAASLLSFAPLAPVHAASPADIPEAIKPPAGEKLLFRARATGAQIYVCGQAANGKPAWTLKAPEAVLRGEKGALIGHHSAGPSWKLNDGSEVTAKVVARVDSPDRRSIPWLLLTAVSHAGEGGLSRATSIQRVHTRGGQPPPDATCDPASRQGKTHRSSYSADYYFYGPAADD